MHKIQRGDGFMLTSEQKALGAVAQQPANDNSWLSQLTAPVVNFGRAFTAAAALVGAGAPKLEGGIIPDGANDADFRARGAQYAGPITTTGGGAVAIQTSFDDPNSPTGRSAYWVSGAIYNERTVITAAHVLMGLPGVRPKVVIGPNFRATDAAVYTVEKFVSNPLFTDKNSSRGSTFDLAVLVLAEPIKGTLPAKLSNTPLPAGELAMMNGCGRTGTPNTTYTTRQDGFFRAGTSRLDNDPIPGESREFYRRSFFQPTARPGDMRGAGGDSGGPVFLLDNQGRVASLAGLIVSGSIDITGSVTGILDLSHPDVQAFIKQHAAYSELKVTDSESGVSVSWAQSADFSLQISSSPSGVWNNYTNTITINGGFAQITVPHGTKDNSQFFRLKPR
jgi:hypothetical protein